MVDDNTSYDAEECRLESIDMLVETKVEDTPCMKLICENIENKTMELTNTQNTFENLHRVGGLYFKGIF